MPRLTSGSTIGNFPYRIDQHIGKGNMADVYLATVGETPEGKSPNYVVLKIARTDGDHKEFYHNVIDNEANRLRQLRHPNVVRLLPIATGSAQMAAIPYVGNASLPGHPQFMVMEYLSGGSLEDLLKSKKQLELGMALEIGHKIASALDYIHRHETVHQDIKPDNILFRRPLQSGREIEPVLMDFGIARAIGQEGLEARTIHYAPPERLSKSTPPEMMPPPHPSMDVWSLGVVLYQMVTGQRPFDERSDKRLTSAILETEPKEPSQLRGNLPSELDKLILRTLAKLPAARPTAHELAQQLEEIAIKQGFTPSVRSEPPSRQETYIPKRVDKPGRGGLLVLAGIVAILVLALLTSPSWRGTMSAWLVRQMEGLIVQMQPDSGDKQPTVESGTHIASIPDATHTPTAISVMSNSSLSATITEEAMLLARATSDSRVATAESVRSTAEAVRLTAEADWIEAILISKTLNITQMSVAATATASVTQAEATAAILQASLARTTTQVQTISWLSIVSSILAFASLSLAIYVLSNRDRRRRATEIVTGTVKAVTQPFVRQRRGKFLAKLILVDSAGVPGLPSMIPLRENGTIKIGRDPDLVGVALNDQRVSRLHCRITDDASGGFRVWDEGSASGTSVNDEDVPMQGTVLRPGDLLAIGPIEYRFEIDISQSDTEPYVRTERRS